VGRIDENMHMNTSHVKFVKIAFLIGLGLFILGTVLYDGGKIRNAFF
jgi:hypothetical protein